MIFFKNPMSTIAKSTTQKVVKKERTKLVMAVETTSGEI